MKLGEALKLRSDNLRRIEELRQRAATNAQIQEGTQPADDANVLVAEIERLMVDTTSLIQRINRTNVATRIAGGTLLADAIVQRDSLIGLRNQLHSIARAASEPQQRYLRSEIRVVRTVDTATLLKRADDLSKQHRVLDAAIQEVNWGVELLD